MILSIHRLEYKVKFQKVKTSFCTAPCTVHKRGGEISSVPLARPVKKKQIAGACYSGQAHVFLTTVALLGPVFGSGVTKLHFLYGDIFSADFLPIFFAIFHNPVNTSSLSLVSAAKLSLPLGLIDFALFQNFLEGKPQLGCNLQGSWYSLDLK